MSIRTMLMTAELLIIVGIVYTLGLMIKGRWTR